jgi:hypothetical protein
MADVLNLRTTVGIVDQVSPDGTVFLYEEGSRKFGFVGNNTPVMGLTRLVRGTRLSIDVEDKGNVMVVVAAHAA